MSIEDYKIQTREGRAVSTGSYEITRFGNRRPVTHFRELLHTTKGTFLIDEWEQLALAAVMEDGKEELLHKIEDHCRVHCAWLHEEREVRLHALTCMASHAYEYWNDFKSGPIVPEKTLTRRGMVAGQMMLF